MRNTDWWEDCMGKKYKKIGRGWRQETIVSHHAIYAQYRFQHSCVHRQLWRRKEREREKERERGWRCVYVSMWLLVHRGMCVWKDGGLVHWWRSAVHSCQTPRGNTESPAVSAFGCHSPGKFWCIFNSARYHGNPPPHKKIFTSSFLWKAGAI